MMQTMVLFADAETWIKVVGGIVVTLIYLVNHVVGAAGKAQQRRQMRPEPRPDPRPRGARPRTPADRQEVQDEVAEFLRRAAEKRAAKPGPPGRAANAAPAEILEARTAEELSTSPMPSGRQPRLDLHDFSEREELSERGGLSQRGEHLSHVERGEAAFRAHMQVFEHQVGRIDESAANPPAPLGDDQADAGPQTVNAPPNEVFAALLSDPQSLRQAIILNEIIDRPVGRW